MISYHLDKLHENYQNDGADYQIIRPVLLIAVAYSDVADTSAADCTRHCGIADKRDYQQYHPVEHTGDGFLQVNPEKYLNI